MNYLEYLAEAQAVEACVAGAGSFGISLMRQSMRMQSLTIRVVIERETRLSRQALENAGHAPDTVVECHNAADAWGAWQAGHCVAADDIATVIDLPFDILVEATGIPEIGARHACVAIEAGKHVGIATKETESIVGPWLTRAARERGLIFTPLDGDQPALLIDLVTWARTLGFEIIAAGKSSEYDFVWDTSARAIVRHGTTHPAAGMADAWDLGPAVSQTVAHRAAAVTDVRFVSAPDLCELTNVANATGLVPDIPTLHGAILRVPEVPCALDVSDNGGLLEGAGRVEVFNCLRGCEELSFAGGVFVVVRCEGDEDWALLKEKGHVVSQGRHAAMIYLPRHLLGLEAPISILQAVAKGLTCGGGAETQPAIDLIGRAEQDFAAGHRFDMEGHHREFVGVRPEMHPARALDHGAAAPLYMLPGARLSRDVAAGELIPFQALAEVACPTLLKLRRLQDDAFLIS